LQYPLREKSWEKSRGGTKNGGMRRYGKLIWKGIDLQIAKSKGPGHRPIAQRILRAKGGWLSGKKEGKRGPEKAQLGGILSNIWKGSKAIPEEDV